MPPRIRIFGGVHHCPGSRRSLIKSVTNQPAPSLVAVEWGRAVYQSAALARARVAQAALSRWDFLTATEADELSAALGWEAEVPTRLWPNVEVAWLEDEWQADDLQRRHQMGCDEFAAVLASGLIDRISNAAKPTIQEFLGDENTAPAEPTSLDLLVDRLGKKASDDTGNDHNDNDLHRDERWLRLLEPRLTQLEGWVAVMVGWLHADPSATGRLYQLLTQRGLKVESVRLGP